MKNIPLFLLVILHATIIGISSQSLFDLNGDLTDGSFNGPDLEFIDDEEYIFKNTSSYKFNDSVEWDGVHAFIVGDRYNGFIDWAYNEARIDGRLPTGFLIEDIMITHLPSKEINLPSPYNESIFGDVMTFQSDKNTSTFIPALFNGLKFNVGNETIFEKRLVCIAAKASNTETFTVGCLNITYVGTNDNRVIINYEQLSDRIFMEGSDPIHVLGNNLIILHNDHPKFLLQSIEVELMHPMMKYESLGFDGIGNYFEYDQTSGRLMTLPEVEGTPEFFTELMLNVTYNNINPEPQNDNRTIIFSVSDGYTKDTELSVFILVQNTNDDTVIMFSDKQLMQFIEGSNEQVIDSGLVINDNDIDPHIENISIELVGLDDEKEFIILNTTTNLIDIHVDNNESTIFLSGVANLSEYATLLHSLKYIHTDANPGNPTLGVRTIHFIINDGRGETDNEFNFTVLPINDPPILLFIDDNIEDDDNAFLTGNVTHSAVTYAEDDSSIAIASNIYLRDFDSPIASAVVFLENKSENDMLSFNDSLLSIYNVTLKLVNGTNQFKLSGIAQAIEYEKIFRSIGYLNKIQDDSIVNEGQKIVRIVANDTDNAQSEVVEIVITLSKTDDQPEFEINDIIEFTEGSTSVEIATPEILSLMDEEEDDIASISVQLYATNGAVDNEDSLIYRSKTLIPTELNRTHITLNQTTTIEDAEEFLRSIRYINQADEPTYYANVTRKEILRRIILVTFTPVGGETRKYDIDVNITLVNDKKPTILIGLHDDICNSSRPSEHLSIYSKRDTSSFTKLQRRLYNKRRNSNIPGLAPSVVAAYSSSDVHQSCINNITIEFSLDTNTPPVEVKRDLTEFVSVLPNGLSPYLSYGEWKDQSTLVIYFTGCYTLEDTSLQIVLKGKGDAHCNATSRCTGFDGICFKNATGCPVLGLLSVLTNYTVSDTATDITPSSPASMSFDASLMLYGGIFIIAIITILMVWGGFKHVSTDNSKSKSSEKPVTKVKKMLEDDLKLDGAAATAAAVPPVQTLLPHQTRDVPSDVVCEDHRKRRAQDDMSSNQVILKNLLKEQVTSNKQDHRTLSV